VPASKSPRSLIAVVALLALGAVLARLGVWQWQRAAEARAIGERFGASLTLAPLTAPPADADRESLRFREAELGGEYVPGRQFLLDNMVHDGVAGYYVLTPWRADGGDWVLVNRGWVPAHPDRSVLPSVALDASPASVRGRIERLPQPGLRLGGAADVHGAAPLEVVEFPTAGEIGDRLSHGVRDYQLLLDAEEPEGYVRDWVAPGLSPERHLVYAGQWLLLAGGAVAAAVAIAIRAALRARASTNAT
jgi:surfeit locus 1 family protein